MIKPFFAAIGIVLCLCSCESKWADEGREVQAYVPVYAQLSDVSDVSIGSVRATENAGKIYAWGSYIFQNEINKGIHVIDNADKAHPQKIAFLEIPYNTEFVVRGSYIYANNINDLIVIDIHDVSKPQVVKRVENGFPYISQTYPPGSGYFICPDPKKGIVVDWKLENVSSAACRR